ncbi:unnamed protein product [Cyprideis torosa]|uniref:Nucleoside diphosphate kinase n=1 Tax=Cyprideis torosa TaxID=163714 RepID=A0A7R8WL11_9CRUS|nr:unnamed protein product [Cyprideis torosa]CAG0897543.1 unnamed protein product [Cyprideis torosa]
MRLQLTLAIIKPDVALVPHIRKSIIDSLISSEFVFIRSKRLQLDSAATQKFYEIHKEKFFFQRLVTFMASGPCSVHLLAHPEAISKWRQMLGPTKVYKTMYEQPDTLRGRYGLSDTRNVGHGSDSEETMRNEVMFFFPSFDFEEWEGELRPAFEKAISRNQLRFDADTLQHHVSRSGDSEIAPECSDVTGGSSSAAV